MDFVKEIVYHSLIVIGVLYGVAALFWMMVELFFKDHSYDVNWIETLCFVLAAGITCPICIAINDNNFKLHYRAEAFVYWMWEPLRKRKVARQKKKK